MPRPAYVRPSRLEEALQLLARGDATILSGGTDYYPARVGKPLRDNVLDVSRIPGLRGISEQPDHWRIGATTTWTDLIEARLPPLFEALKLAAREVGGMQIQNRGTVAGNLCNASPAADGIPPLLALDAAVEISSADRTRRVPLQEFILSSRRTALGHAELVTAVIVPKPRLSTRSHFLKLGTRKYLVISIVMVAAMVEHAGGRVRAARIAVGACSPVARRLPVLEAALAGERLDQRLGSKVVAEHLQPLTPIDDVRASSGYRSEAALALVRRTLDQLGAMA